jgi:hypothetical protein
VSTHRLNVAALHAALDRRRVAAERDNPPHAVVTRLGRWWWGVHISHGITVCGPDGGDWHCLGRAAAERKGRRELHRYLAARSPERFEVWPEETVWTDVTQSHVRRRDHTWADMGRPARRCS